MINATLKRQRATLNVEFRMSILRGLRLRLRLFVERALRLFDNCFERACVVHRDVGKNFAIKADAGGFQSLGEAAVGHPVRARGSVESLNPKITECALARFAISIRPVLRLHGRVFGVTKKFGSASAKAFRGLDDAFTPGAAGRRISCSWHLLLCRGSLHDSSFSGLFVNCRSFRPRSLRNPATAGQVERRPARQRRGGESRSKMTDDKRFVIYDILSSCIGFIA